MSADTRPWALGIDLGGTKIHAALLAPDGAEQWQCRVPTPAGDYRGTVAALAALVAQARAASPVPITVGVGGPGAITPEGLVKNANSTCLNGRALMQDLEAAIGQPARYANDANCLALSEATDGAGAGARVVFAVILGTGSGSGIAVDGRVLTGPNQLAGEWGHNPLPWAGPADEPAPPCFCGRHGCVETYVSGPALARDHLAHGGLAQGGSRDGSLSQGGSVHGGLVQDGSVQDGSVQFGPAVSGGVLSGEAIVQRAAEGDPACQATLERHASRLARALAAVINFLDPDVIVLGGGLSRMAHLYTRVPELWTPWVYRCGAPDPVRTRLLPARHGDASGVRGAAWLWRGPAG